MNRHRRPRVALACIGIGRIQRGYERYFSDLFAALRDEIDITLFKSGGDVSERQKIPLALKLTTALARLLPLGTLSNATEFRHYKNDCLAFSLSLLPALVGGRYDVVHVIDFPLAVALHKLRPMYAARTRLLFTNGCCMPHQFCPASAHIHHVARPYYEDARAFGIPESRLTLVPCGIDLARFAAGHSRKELRRRHGISENTFVVLSVAAVKRLHKRIDHVIEETARMPGDVLLWLDGAPEDPEVPRLAREKLGSRCIITFVASEQVGELYNLADVLVHASLGESFGLSIAEAMLSGLPVLCHDSQHFEWLTGDRSVLVDMSAPGKLAERLSAMAAGHLDLSAGADRRAASVARRFAWRSLIPEYVRMYSRVAGLPPQAANDKGDTCAAASA